VAGLWVEPVALAQDAIAATGDLIMTSSKMPRRFWSYTAGKGSTRAEEIEAARDRKLQNFWPTFWSLLGLGFVLLLALLMLLMMLAEFRGFYLDQIKELLRPG